MKLTTSNLWFTSDTHYGHTNICRGVSQWGSINSEGVFEVNEPATRDFLTVDYMNNQIVSNINSVVDANDWLVHLGDWSFGGFEKIEEFREKINCKNITLIMGNHDQHIQSNKSDIQKLFTHVSHYEELSVTREKKSDKNAKFILCHYPIISWNGQHKGTKMLHGHQHLKGDARVTQKDRMDIGMCGSPEFRPYHIEEILEHFNDVNNQVDLSE